ncbi:hypothetical protein J6590_036999 [Homalodisca vitripennis]|nr:hypothetical protein J6590_036999 [Homalodisca vitripennis]
MSKISDILPDSCIIQRFTGHRDVWFSCRNMELLTTPLLCPLFTIIKTRRGIPQLMAVIGRRRCGRVVRAREL